MSTKICSKCKQEKNVELFYKSIHQKDGFTNQCKSCVKQSYEDKKDKKLEYQKSYRTRNIEKITEYQKNYKTRNKEKISERGKQFYKENKDKVLLWQKNYRESDNDKIKYRNKRYYNTFALYLTYRNQLTVDEEPRLAEDGISLEVRCKYCGKYYIPTNQQVMNRILAINGNGNGDQFLYCSEGCKKSCSVYKQRKYPKGFKPATSREVQPQLRKLVLERDNWTCQKSGSIEELHCHHIDPVINNPIESADTDNCITYCSSCHKETHQQDGCKYGELKKCR